MAKLYPADVISRAKDASDASVKPSRFDFQVTSAIFLFFGRNMLQRIQSLGPTRTPKAYPSLGKGRFVQALELRESFFFRPLLTCRQQVAKYIDRRDGALVPPADPEVGRASIDLSMAFRSFHSAGHLFD